PAPLRVVHPAGPSPARADTGTGRLLLPGRVPAEILDDLGLGERPRPARFRAGQPPPVGHGRATRDDAAGPAHPPDSDRIRATARLGGWPAPAGPRRPGQRRSPRTDTPVTAFGFETRSAPGQWPSPRTSRNLRANASGWPAYPNSPPRKPPWWLGNTVGF